MIHFIIGTRAQLFKTAPVIRECDKYDFDLRWVYMARHKDITENTLKVFELKDRITYYLTRAQRLKLYQEIR